MSGDGVDVVMPRLGESIVEGTVVRWAVTVGQTVRRGELLAEVETDKATSEIPASIDGVVDSLLVDEGATVPVGAAVARLRRPGDPGRPSASTTTPTRESDAPKAAASRAAPPDGRLPTQRLVEQPALDAGGPRRTSPAVRRLARTHGIDIHGIAGTGHKGRVTRDDILAAVERAGEAAAPGEAAAVARSGEAAAVISPVVVSPAPAASGFRGPRYTPGPNDRLEPLSRRRKLIAQHLKHSIDTAAHVATVAEIDMNAVYTARKIDGAHLAQQGMKLTVLAYVVQAVAQTLSEVPLFNTTVQDDQLIWRADRNVGIAVDTPNGVIVPVIRRADELGLSGIARAIDSLSAAARDGSITADDLTDGTFTISNPGREGNLFGISIIRQPEVGILRIGSVVKRPVVRQIDGDDAIVVRPIMYAALSYDHRLIDGRTGNGFLFRLARRLEEARATFGPQSA